MLQPLRKIIGLKLKKITSCNIVLSLSFDYLLRIYLDPCNNLCNNHAFSFTKTVDMQM